MSAWDQNAALHACSPAAAIVEQVSGQWLKELLALPHDSSFAFVTGCQMAHVACLTAARQALWLQLNHDVASLGLAGAADSWATDGHKVLNTPFDCGYAFVAHPEAHKAVFSLHASYLTHADDRLESRLVTAGAGLSDLRRLAGTWPRRRRHRSGPT